jgi:UDP-2,3-diacylglucosamine pyrophosphatase LpxH
VKRDIEYCIISDVHLGTVGSHANELCDYLDSVNVKNLIILGDFIDGWNFKKKYFPESHFRVLKKIFKMLQNDTNIYYLTGNHDEFLRKFSHLQIGNLHILDSLEIDINDKRYWIFHGDVFDIAMQYKFGKIISMLAGKCYDYLIKFNKLYNNLCRKFNIKEYSLSSHIKKNVKTAIKYIQDYEIIACETASKKKFDYVINGHIHQPNIKEYFFQDQKVVYMNSGDWVENLTSLELKNTESNWQIYKHKK